MTARLLSAADPAAIGEAAAVLREGGLVAFGTETVYGLGANALDPTAVAKVFAAKDRPRFDPLIVHLPGGDDAPGLATVVADLPDDARALAERFWPGPLTLVLPKAAAVPDLVTAGLGSVAVRVPASEPARALLRAAGVPVAAPSANRFGGISPTTAAHVAEGLGEAVDLILDAGPCEVGIESTVVGFETDAGGARRPVVLRPGAVTAEALGAALGRTIEVRTGNADPGAAQTSPGSLSRHYAPRTPLTLVDDAEEVEAAGACGLLAFLPPPRPERFAACETLSATGDLTEAAAGFYAALRRLDALGLPRLAAVRFPPHGLGAALNDRLRRAAAG
ncbi:L-threonylcarbamoyladenylate synthase [Alienimonas californiensis]|uniref:Threonylcarbamoyl-AMP synthase n=1 Tax=Alienimonas californiensis TaxID=2527989 RepID=A0A517PEU2_9PLAN|nr:L-threonylcarbamoyladenylate synthase [Alienimonas californiensis]QDT17892.1 Threonylcarbamoyl-AMP synthase [Alienimonas californiensis]